MFTVCTPSPSPFLFKKGGEGVRVNFTTLSRKKKLGKIFVGEKFSHFSAINFSNSSLFSNQLLQLKGLSWVGLLFFQRKVVLLVWEFSNWARRSALLLSLIHGIGCSKYTASWISQNKKFLYKLIFHNYKILRRYMRNFNHTFFYFYLIIIIHFTIMKLYNI